MRRGRVLSKLDCTLPGLHAQMMPRLGGSSIPVSEGGGSALSNHVPYAGEEVQASACGVTVIAEGAGKLLGDVQPGHGYG